MNLGKTADILGIIGFVGAIVAGLWGAIIASQLMIAFALAYVIGYLAYKVWQLERENKRLREMIANKTAKVELRQYFDDSIWISSSRKNKQLVASDFILWDECTLMVWVYMPPRGEGLRDSNHNRCLLAHTTGRTDTGENYNGFTLRHNEYQQWKFSFSNNKAKYGSKQLLVDDGLEHGWHHLLIRWNKLAPELSFLIDKGNCGNDRSSSFLSYWPEKNDENITVGAGTSGDASTYCETKLLSLWICNKFLSPDDEILITHFSREPR